MNAFFSLVFVCHCPVWLSAPAAVLAMRFCMDSKPFGF
jgi:hypothetical protein